MNLEITSWRSGGVLFSFETDSLKLALEAAVKSDASLEGANLRGADLRDAYLGGASLEGANLRGADLRDAYLGGASLRGANLRSANLEGANLRDANLEDANLEDATLEDANLEGATLRGAKLETGETLDEYRCDVVPALLAAGGHPVPEAAWSCHSWDNCPMAEAFGVHKAEDVPRLYRPRVDQFVRLFDAGVPVRPEVAQ